MERGSRIRCRIPCEVSLGRTRTKGSVLDLSEGGLALVTRLVLNEGDDVCIKLHPHRREGAIDLQGLVWSCRKRASAGGKPAPPVLGIMISDAPAEYGKLLRRLEQQGAGGARVVRGPATETKPVSVSPGAALRQSEKASFSAVTVVNEAPSHADTTLPKPKFPLPPPKRADPESLPLFNVRVKQSNGTRTRRLKLRCASVHDVERQVREDLDGSWEILEINSVGTTSGKG